MDKLNQKLLASPNLQQERLEQLKQLMPDLFTDEGTLNPVALKELVDPDYLAKERYNFSWYGKADARLKAFSPSYATLVKDAQRSVHPQDSKGNMIIEGENLEVLKVLLHSYRESIKCIYIDPPYNTGSDFVYKDSWASNSQEYLEAIGATANGIKLTSLTNSDGRKHSHWLSMIYPRLLVARQLLREDGVIFVSIDDHEQANLKKVMDEVFGEENFVAQFIWERAYSPKNDAKYVSNSHDYILCYAKQINSFQIGRLPRTEEANARYQNPDNDPRGVWKSSDMSVKTYNSNTDYPITTPSGRIVNPPLGRCWRVPKEKIQELVNDNRIWFGSNGNSVPQLKRFLSELKNEGMTTTSMLHYKEVGHNQEGTKEVTSLFNAGIFDGPKPVRLLTRILQIANVKRDDIILDFFAGSGTTAHAVMDLNTKDGGNRKFILVQLKEQIEEDKEAYKAGYKFISDITIDRNKKAIEKNLYNTGFTVYALAQSHFPRVEFELDKRASQEQNLANLEAYIAQKENALVLSTKVTSEQALLDEVLLKQGFRLDYTLAKQPCTTNIIYKVQDSYQVAYVCVDTRLKTESIAYLSTLHDSLFICLGVALDTSQRYELKQILGNNLIII